MNTAKLKKAVIRALPYVLTGLLATNIGEAWRLADGMDYSTKLVSFFCGHGHGLLRSSAHILPA